MCNMSDCVCAVLYMSLCFLPAAPIVSVVPVVGVVFTGVIIVTVVVVTVCLLMVAKHKHRKNSLGEDYTAVFCSPLLFFFTAPFDHVYWMQTTTENRFVLSHMHVQICLLSSFRFASQFFFCRYVEKNYLKVTIRHTCTTMLENFVLSELNLVHQIDWNFYLSVQCVATGVCMHVFHNTQWLHVYCITVLTCMHVYMYVPVVTVNAIEVVCIAYLTGDLTTCRKGRQRLHVLVPVHMAYLHKFFR